MKLLSVCIPNYNRIDKLERLILEVSRQIVNYSLEKKVQICISDDCSSENPYSVIEAIKKKYSGVDILYRRNEHNYGMDYNFFQSVMMSSSQYCWIIGNDDLPTKNGIKIVYEILRERKEIDILLTPFNIYDEYDQFRGIVYPLDKSIEIIYDTSDKKQYNRYIRSVAHNSGLFGFLSNVVFKKENWNRHKDKFKDKFNTIFIQMYMNIQTLEDGAFILYAQDHIIKNYADDITNSSLDRIYKILLGLNGVVDYFFEGTEKLHLKRVIVDTYINGVIWDIQDERKEKILEIDSPKNEIYKKYFLEKEHRKEYLKNKKIIIYGAGNCGRKVYQDLQTYNVSVIGIADSDCSKENKEFNGFHIMSVENMIALYKEQKAYVLVANHFCLEEMINVLLENGVERIAIIS